MHTKMHYMFTTDVSYVLCMVQLHYIGGTHTNANTAHGLMIMCKHPKTYPMQTTDVPICIYDDAVVLVMVIALLWWYVCMMNADDAGGLFFGWQNVL